MCAAEDFDSCKLIFEEISNKGLNLGLNAVNETESAVNNFFILNSETLNELQHHLNTLSCFKLLHTLPEETLIRVLHILHHNVISVFSEDFDRLNFKWVDNEENFIRLSSSINAAVALLKIITCHKMPIKVLNEDMIARVSKLLKIIMNHVLRPTLTSTRKEIKRVGKRSRSSRIEYPITIQFLISKVLSIFESYTELVRQNMLESSFVIALSEIAVEYFFFCDALDLQTQIIFLLGNIFTVMTESSHVELMRTIVNYICNPLLCKRQWEAYNDTNEVYIEVHLIIQIVQALTSLPGDEDSRKLTKSKELVNHRLKHAQQLLSFLFRFFILGSEDDYRKTIFSCIVNDFLLLLNKPEYPVCTFFLTVLGKHLMEIYKQKTLEVSIRSYCLDLIGTIVISLIKTPPYVKESPKIIEIILSNIKPAGDFKNLNETQFLQRCLIDYLILSNKNCMTEFALKYYVVAWQYQLKDQIGIELEKLAAKQAKSKNKKELTPKAPFSVQFLQILSHPKYIRKRVKEQPALLTDVEASVVARHVTTVGDAYLKYEPFVNYILHAITSDSPILRTKALKYMCQLVETDAMMLQTDMLCHLVKDRLLLDPNSFVREATMDLVGMAIARDASFVEFFDNQLISRLQDSSVFVRKRVARILRFISETYTDSVEIPRLLYNFLGRVDDNESVKSILVETFISRYFSHQGDDLYYSRAANELISIAQFCMANNTVSLLESLIKSIVNQFPIATSALSKLSRRLIQCLLPFKSEDGAQNSLADSSKSFVFSVICILSRIGTALPDILIDHVDDVIWFLEYAINSNVQSSVVKDILSSLDQLIPSLEISNNESYSRIHAACGVLLRTGTKTLIPYVTACLAEVYRKFPSSDNPILALFLESLDLLNKVKDMFENPSNDPLPSTMDNILRSFYSIGVFSRYFNFDVIFAGDETTENHAQDIDLTSPKRSKGPPVLRRFRDNIYAVLIFFAARGHPDFSANSLFSLGHLCITYSEYIQTETVYRLYDAILSSTNPRVLPSKVQIINNVKNFLLSEEEKMTASRIVVDGRDDLKKMDAPENCVSSIVMQSFFKLIAKSYIHEDESLRTSSCEIVCVAVHQGFINPAVCVQELVAMSSDPLLHVKEKAVSVIEKVQSLHKDCFAGKTGMCCMKVFELQQLVQNSKAARGFRVCEGNDDSEFKSVIWDYYKIFSDNRAQRRVVLSSLLSFFSEVNSEKMPTERLMFLGDSLITLPFKTADEVLYLIKHIDGVITLAGQSYLLALKETIFEKEFKELDDEESFFDQVHLTACLLKCSKKLEEVLEKGKVCILLQHMKMILTAAYNLSEKKIREYSVSEPKLYMRSISRRAVSFSDYNDAVMLLRLNSKLPNKDLASKIASHVSQFHTMLFSLEED
ncbi:unnamed protein product [Auanema sp. JU1783]|nr:unnamed protein product [Auanema sp. JU1783]